MRRLVSYAGLPLVMGALFLISGTPAHGQDKKSDKVPKGMMEKVTQALPDKAPAQPKPVPPVATKDPSAGPAAPTNAPPQARAAYRMRVNDPILIFLRDLPDREHEQQLEEVIDDKGFINLPYIGRIHAEGKTTSDLEQEIEHRYIADKIYLRITVNIVIPQQVIFVNGEVKIPNKYQLVPGMLLMNAITSASGFNDFADREHVELIRNGQKRVFNCKELEKHPEKDVPLESGDQINVTRSWL